MREKVQQTAKELGYRPNPFVSAFTAQVRGYRRSPQHASIAILNSQPTGIVSDCDKQYTKGAAAWAKQIGFRADVFPLMNWIERRPGLCISCTVAASADS